jgi:hypothetical protein
MRANVEWRYFAGRQEDGKHFHYAEFRHWSLNGKFYEDIEPMSVGLHIRTPQFEYDFTPMVPAIKHQLDDRNYVTIPKVVDGKVEAWYDHDQINEIVGPNWDWVGLNLDCGMTILVLWRADGYYADLTYNGRTKQVKCILDGRHLFLYDTGQYLMLDDTQLNPPSTQNIIHKPKYGRPYSEWAFDVVSKGGIIGRGIREKTYKEM